MPKNSQEIKASEPEIKNRPAQAKPTKAAPAQTKHSAPKKSGKESKAKGLIPEGYQTLASFLLIVLLFLIHYAPMYFGNQTFQSGDIVTSRSLVPYVEQSKEGYTLWNPYVFCGMPAHAMAVGFKWFNLIYVGISSLSWLFKSLFSTGYAVWTLYLIIMAFNCFLLIKHLTGSRLLSLFSAIAMSFSTGIVVFLFLGHVTKLTGLAFYPLILLFLLKFNEKIRLRDALLLTVALQLMVQGWHVQIIFYILFSIAIFYLYYLLRALVKKDGVRQVIKSAAVFAAAMITALLIQADNLTQVYLYSEYSTRGTKSIIDQTAQEKKTADNFYDYATWWSFSPGEIMTFIVPSWYGFGNSHYEGPVTNNQEYVVNTYFGQMESVDTAMYMGVLIFVFGIFGMYTERKNPFVQFLSILSVTALFISFGKNLPWLFDPMFNYFPFFNKFRVPSMALVLVQMSFPVLSAFGLKGIIDLAKGKNIKAVNIIKTLAIAASLMLVLSFILSGAIKDWFISRIGGSDKAEQVMKYFSGYASDMFHSDLLIAFAIISITLWLAWGVLGKKIKAEVFISLIILFTVIDLFRINSRAAEYHEAQDVSQAFIEPDYIKAIKSQNDTQPFRIISLKEGSYGTIVNNMNANYHAYFFMQDISGYSGVKPRSYQDIMDVAGTPANFTFMRLANVRYLVFDKPVQYPGLTQIYSSPQSSVYRNEGALPRAFFTDSVRKESAVNILTFIKNNSFDPRQTAFLEEDAPVTDRPDSTAFAVITEYKDEKISMNVNASGTNFLFLSDTYYPNGWYAYIDGKETRIYRTNHHFRGITVPKGMHKVEFIYSPLSFKISQAVAFGLSSLIILGLLLSFLTPYVNGNKLRS